MPSVPLRLKAWFTPAQGAEPWVGARLNVPQANGLPHVTYGLERTDRQTMKSRFQGSPSSFGG